MHYGVTIFPTAYAMHPAELGPALEQRGFESLWVAEHSHIPLGSEALWPGGGALPQMYYDTLDPFVALSAAAATTSTLKLGTGIALVVQRDVIHTAKAVASLDVVSNGRAVVGVGAGWNVPEMVDHGTDPSRRFGRMRESVAAMKEIWTSEVASFEGDQIEFGPMHCNPKPLQSPHPPIHVGGVYPGGLRRAVAYADGWIPISGRGEHDLATQLEAVATACEEAGRGRHDFEVSIYAAPNRRDALDELEAMGADRAVFLLPPWDGDRLLPHLDDLATLLN